MGPLMVTAKSHIKKILKICRHLVKSGPTVYCHFLIMAAVHSRCRHYIFVLLYCCFGLIACSKVLQKSFFLSFFPRQVNSAVADWMSTILPHMVWPYANLECRSEMYCTRLAGNTGRKKSPSRHNRTTLSGYIFATKTCIDNRKKNLLNSNTSSTCPRNMVNFGPLTAEIGSGVWGTTAHFNRFCVLAALLRGTLVVGISQTLRR